MSATRPAKIRLDELLVRRGLAESRTQAQALVRAGKVRRGTEVWDKPGRAVPEDASIVIEQGPRFVGRGAEKLEGFLEIHPVPVAGAHILDVGASTGGFTDCLLQRGAASAVCVDVGRGQLHPRLRSDARVTSLEGINARGLESVPLPRPLFDIVVMDLSFISLAKVLPAAWHRVRPGGCLCALVKPQFEATKEEADRGRGVIRDPEVHQRVRSDLRSFALAQLDGAEVFAETESVIQGGDGNREFWLGLRRASALGVPTPFVG